MPHALQPHDAFARRLFADLEHAADELRAVLPQALVARIDWTTLKREPGSYVDESLRARHTDLLFSMRTTDAHDLRVHVLFEHQSRPDAWMPLRASEYALRIWSEFRRKNPGAKRLPVVIPVVLHHGARGWTAPRSLHELVDPLLDDLPELRHYVLNTRIIVDDLVGLSDQDIAARSRALALQIGLWLLRDGRRDASLLASLVRWGPVIAELIARPDGARAHEYQLRYLFHVAHDDVRVAFRNLVDQTHPEAREAVMTIEEMLINQGLEKGRQEGRQEGRQQGRQEIAAKAVLRVLERRGLSPSDAERAQVQAIMDVALLEHLLDRAVDVTSVAELFAN